jgi:hypothetical protein
MERHLVDSTWKCSWALAVTALAGGLGLAADTPATIPAAASAATRPRDADTPARRAVRRGVAYLLAQAKNGAWEREPTRNGVTHTGGETALVAYTLLHLGECLDEPTLRPESDGLAPGLDWLTRLDPKTTYTAAMQAMVLAKLPLSANADNRKAAEKARDYLISAMRVDGGYTYPAEGKDRSAPDNANACFAVQALAALQLAGVETPPATWNLADEYWHLRQHKDGGWAYDQQTRTAATAGMTAAGVASLQLTAAFSESKPVGVEVPRDMALANGLTFLASEFKPASRDYFFLYQLQRAAGGAGLRMLARQDVCKAAAAALVASQDADGSWKGEFADPTIIGEQRLVSTCYALLVLSEGFQPVAFSKLEYPGDARWDARPRDVANLTLWLSSRLSRPMRWQIVGPGTPPADDIAAPILVIAGSKDPQLTDAMLERIRRFVEAGGVVLSVAVGPEAADFTTAVTQTCAPRALGKKYGFRDLPSAHPLFDLWGKMPPLRMLAMSNGVRELWIHIPSDVDASWQARRMDSKDHFMLPVNLYSYATGKGEPWRAELPPDEAATASAPATATTARTVTLARVLYGGNADPEPAAWARFARRAPAMFHTRLTVELVPAARLDAAAYPVAHLLGTGKLVLSDAETAALKAYVAAGGLLVVEAAGGDPAFAASAPAVLATLVAGATLTRISPNDQLYNGAMPDSARLVSVSYRKFSLADRPLQVAPQLKGLSSAGRWAVVFSADDITSGLLGTSTWGIAGYAPRDADAIARNLLLYSLKPIVPPTTGADSQPAP